MNRKLGEWPWFPLRWHPVAVGLYGVLGFALGVMYGHWWWGL